MFARIARELLLNCTRITSRIIPAILTNDIEEFKKMAELLAPYVDVFHLDVMDGTMIKAKSLSDSQTIVALHLPVSFEAHLMIDNPETTARQWIKIGARRVIIHGESKGNIGLAIEDIKRSGREAGIALNPDTVIKDFEDLFPLVSIVQLMAVIPGAQGRTLDEKVFDRIGYIRKKYPALRLAVDGGVNETNIKQLAQAGVEDLVIGSAIVQQKNPVEALQILKNKLASIQDSVVKKVG